MAPPNDAGSATVPSAPPTAAATAQLDFLIESRGGFDTNFAVVPANGYTPTGPEAQYLARLLDCVAALADIAPLANASVSQALQTQKERVRDRAVRELRTRAEVLIKRPCGAGRESAVTNELAESYRIEGRYREWMRRVDTIPFTVEAVPFAARPGVFYDLNIKTRDVHIADERGRLKIDIDSALTVVKTVFSERVNGISWLWYVLGRYATKLAAVQDRWHEYIIQLNGIASVGLMNVDPTQVGFARQDLDRFKKEFTSREAGQVKNHYVHRLGICCLTFAILFSLLYAVAYDPASGRIMHAFRNFFLLAAGAVVGTWLSFLLRRVTLTFDDLAVLEEDRLNPSIRVLFMVALVTVLGLLFWSQAIVAGIGTFQSAEALHSHGAWALLMGLLAGIAERALGTAVSRRASDFVTAIGSGGPTVQVR